VLADRLDARRTVIGTQTAQLISASALAWIALGGFAEPWMLYTIAFINGTVLVLDVPSRQQLTYRMVGRDDLPNAIGLNSTLFNASRIFGPAIAGVVLVAGAGVCFLTNAISYLAVLIGLWRCAPLSSSRWSGSSDRGSSRGHARGSPGSAGSGGCSSCSR